MDEFGEMDMEEKRLKDILYSNIDPVLKVQHLIRLGYDEEVANEVVERYQIGQHAPVYYERLDLSKDYGDEEYE